MVSDHRDRVVRDLDGETEIRLRSMSLDEYLALARPEGTHVEWARGEAVFVNAAQEAHNIILSRLVYLLTGALPGLLVIAEQRYLMADALREPDISVVRGRSADPRWTLEPPVVVVEVSSPGTWRIDLLDKSREYAREGVSHYWTFDSEVLSATFRTNIGDGWRIDVVLDASNPAAEIDLGDAGTVTIRHEDVFRGLDGPA